MKRTVKNVLYPALAIMFLCAAPLRAAEPSEGAVTGSGRVVIKRQPQLLRMQMMLSAEGKDIAEAAAKLKEAQMAAGKTLATLGADVKATTFGSMQVAGGAGDARQQYMQRMMAMQGNRGRKPPVLPQMVSVSLALSAEWPLTAQSPEELLVNGYTLQEKIKASPLNKKDPGRKLSPEEQEAMEEAQGLAQANGNNPSPGDPTFSYVCKVSAEDRDAAMAEAFRKAKVEAARLAKAAGADLGNLRTLGSVINSPTGTTLDEQQAYMRMAMRQMGVDAAAAAATSDTAEGEAVSPNPGSVELQVVVTASFALGAAK